MAQSDIQGFKDSHARLMAAQDSERVPPRPDFHWWKGSDALDAFACLALHGAEGCTLSVRYGLAKDGGVWQAWLVVARGKEILGAFDVSHPCPPDCPE
jgi:hypothetical protein